MPTDNVAAVCHAKALACRAPHRVSRKMPCIHYPLDRIVHIIALNYNNMIT
ncbi:UNVERIFIED_ORG: hypothetical protein QOE_3354 [Clostridioides difficile F501]